MLLSPFLMVGCNQGNYTVSDVSSLYQEVLSIVGNDDGFLSSKLDTAKVKQADVIEDDKAYIFPLVYDSYIKCSSGLFFGVGQRQGNNISNALGKLQQNELNLIYSKLLAVKSNAQNLINNKVVFETTSGDLYYKEFAMSCNNLISSLYDLNDIYNDYYLKYYFEDFTKNDVVLSNNNLKDVLWYYLEKLSQVTYLYELKNFELTNPYGNISNWYDSTLLLKQFNLLATDVLDNLSQQDLVSGIFNEDKIRIIDKLNLLQLNLDAYNENYKSYDFALSKVNIKEYINATNKTAYVSSLSNLEQSYYKIIDNFLNGKYESFFDSINLIISLM